MTPSSFSSACYTMVKIRRNLSASLRLLLRYSYDVLPAALGESYGELPTTIHFLSIGVQTRNDSTAGTRVGECGPLRERSELPTDVQRRRIGWKRSFWGSERAGTPAAPTYGSGTYEPLGAPRPQRSHR